MAYAQVSTIDALRDCYQSWHEEYLALERGLHWSSAIAVRQRSFIENIKQQLKNKAQNREIVNRGADYLLKEEVGFHSVFKS